MTIHRTSDQFVVPRRACTLPPMGFITSEFTRSLATATLGSTLNSSTSAGVISAPPPMPVSPTAKPPTNPASASSIGLALVLR